MCRKLGIKRLPTIHMYQKDKGKIDAFCCGPKKFPMLLERLKRHMETLELESRFSEFTDTLEEGSQLLASVAPESTAATTTQESPTEMAGILQETMMEQDVNDSLETKISIQKTSRGRRQAMQNNQKSWWKRILPWAIIIKIGRKQAVIAEQELAIPKLMLQTLKVTKTHLECFG